MFFPEQPELNETVYIVHCKHNECNDNSPVFNNLDDVGRYHYKHSDFYNGREGDDLHGEPFIYEYKRVRELYYYDLLKAGKI